MQKPRNFAAQANSVTWLDILQHAENYVLC